MDLLPFDKVKREILIKHEAEPGEFGCCPGSRPVEALLDYGVIDLNKPKGPTSHMCSEYVQKILHVAKAGHGGSLDPGVTGVLPIAIGAATRIVQTLLKAGKEYVGIMHVHKDVSENAIRTVAKDFVGKIKQLPPVKAAVVRKVREREVYYLDILEVDGRDVLFRVGCEAGTYIRRICDDFGKKLGTRAHMSELVRTKAGPFSQESWISLQDLEDAYAFWKEEGNEKFLRYCVRPVEFSVQHLPKLWVLDSAVDTLCHGASLNVPGISRLESPMEKGETVAILTLKGELVALGKAVMTAEQIISEKKGLAVRTNKVFMQPGSYPKAV